MISTFLIAAVYTIGSSIFAVLIRYLQRERDQAWAIATVGSWTGAIALAATLEPSSIEMSPKIFLLLLAAGILWAISVYADWKSSEFIEASSGVVLSSSQTVLLVLTGALVFGESFSGSDVVGGLLIFAGVFTALPPRLPRTRQGLTFKLTSIVTAVAAITLDKILCGMTDISLVIWCGYFVPALLYLFIRSRDWRGELVIGGTKRLLLLIAAVVIFVALGPLLVYSFGKGDMTTTFLVAQSKLVFVVLLGALVLGERKDFGRRATAAVLASTGMIVLGIW